MRIAVDCQKDRITQHFADHLTTKECHDYMRERERLVDVDNMIGSFHISRLIDIYCNTFRKCVLFGDWKDARERNLS